MARVGSLAISTNPSSKTLGYDVDAKYLGGVDVLPVYLVTGPLPGFVTSTGVTAVPPIQLPDGVTAGGAELLSLMTSSPSNPKCTELEYERGTKPGVTKFFPCLAIALINPARVRFFPAACRACT